MPEWTTGPRRSAFSAHSAPSPSPAARSEQAIDVFRAGLASCRAAQSAEGTGEHGRGLYSALRLAGKSREAAAHADTLTAEEGISVVDGHTEDPSIVRATLRPPSRKHCLHSRDRSRGHTGD